MKLSSPALQDLILEVAHERFGSATFGRRELMLAVEKQIRSRGFWTDEDDLASASTGAKSKGMANIDFRISDLADAGSLASEGRDSWRLAITPQARSSRASEAPDHPHDAAESQVVSTRAVLDGAPSRMLTWNPKNWEWSDLPKIVEQLRRGTPVEQQWSCGNARSIAIGTRVFMLRQGVEPKGIVASGWVTTAPFEAPHWSAERAAVGDTAYCIKFTPDFLLDPLMNAPLDLRAFQSGSVTTVQLDAPASGNSIPDSAASALEEAWAAHLNAAGHGLGFAEAEFGAFEGEQKRRFVMHRSRERALREAKITQARSRAPDGRIRCEVPGCGFDFEAAYGELGAGYAQVHHLLPLSASGVVWKGLDDLAVVCANCHAMIHRGGACRPLESLRRPISP